MSEFYRLSHVFGAVSLQHEKERNKKVISAQKDQWGAYNSSLREYEITLDPVLFGQKIKDLVSHAEEPTIIDFLAPSGTIRQLFKQLPQPRKLGIAISLLDKRSESEKYYDASLGITQISGDLADTTTWREIRERLNGKKANLIIERGLAGLETIPPHPLFYAMSLQRMWSMLAENGVLLAQINYQGEFKHLGINIQKFQEAMISANIETCINLDMGYGFIYIKKNPDSPRVLPLTSEMLNLPEKPQNDTLYEFQRKIRRIWAKIK